MVALYVSVDGNGSASVWVELALIVVYVLAFPGKLLITFALHLHPDTTGYEIPILICSMCFYWLIAFMFLWIVRMSKE